MPCRRGGPVLSWELYMRVEEVSERFVEDGADDTELVVEAVPSERLCVSVKLIDNGATRTWARA